MISVRNITGYALVKALPPLPNRVVIRNQPVIVGLTALKPSYRSKIAKLHLLDMMNIETLGTFTEAQLSFDSPVVNTIGEKNTKITIRPVGNIPYRQSATLQYNRIPITDYFPDKTWKLTVAVDTTLHALIPAINTAYGCNLVTGDIVDQSVVAGVTGIVIAPNATSYIFAPGSNVQLGTILPTLSSLVTVITLTGFEPVSV